MRIVYTNLKENDAGVKRSVRQFQVDFNGTSARPATGAISAKQTTAPDERDDAQTFREPETVEAGNVARRQQINPPVEGMVGLRRIFIKKFVDTQRAVLAGQEGNVSITV